jgi:nitrogen regulatory protein PII
MHFKLIIAFVEDTKTDAVIHAAREAGATGCTVINNARGEGLEQTKTFFGLTLTSQRDVVMLLVEEHLSRHILEHIGDVGEFDETPGTGIAVQIDVEDAIGVVRQANELEGILGDNL